MKLKLARTAFVLVLLVLFASMPARQASAQDPAVVELENVAALVDFGEQITFVATVKSPQQIRDASILILDEAQGITHVEPLIVQEDGRTAFRYDSRRNSLRPFSPVSWNYRFTLMDGNIISSQVYSTLYDDNRFTWQSLGSDLMRVHWYGGDADFGQAALKTAQAGLDMVGRLIPADLSRPIDIYIYTSLADLRGTLAPGSQEWIAGHADPSLGLVMVVIEPGPDRDITMQQRLPHELMHVMLYRVMGDSYRNLPAWLNEGMAGLAELVYNTAYDRVLQDALARRDWIPLNDLCRSFPADTDRAILAYAEARSFTSFLYEKYGSAGLLSLATAYARDADCDRGPEQAYGVSLSSLEAEWQASAAEENTWMPALQETAPYLVLLGLILLFPVISILSTRRRKGSRNEPETFIRK